MKFLRTLHAKIFTIFFTTTILIILSILFFARSIDTARKSSILSVRKNLSVHLLSQIDKIGIPPRLDVAQSISRDLELRMSISGPGISWRSDAGFDPGSLLRAATDTRFKEVRLGRSGGHLFAISEKEGYQYIFEFQSSEMSFPYHLVLGLATIVIIILLISFVVTRWLMSPVKPLVKGV